MTVCVRYGVTVPGLPGCFSAGDTLDEALDSVREAIDLHLEGMAEEGTPLPEPRSLVEYQADPDYADGVWAVVEVDDPWDVRAKVMEFRASCSGGSHP